MNNKTLGEELRYRRKLRGLTQPDLARRTGIAQARISKLELDKRLPSNAEWHSLRHHLALPQVFRTEKIPLPFPLPCWRVSREELALVKEMPLSSRIYRAQKSFGSLFCEKLDLVNQRDDHPLPTRFLNQACLDSGHEAMFWLHGLSAGGRPCWYAPLKAGFRQFPILDRSAAQKVVGDVRQPCLEIVREGYGLLLFPQVTVQTRRGCYRLDVLVCILRGKKRCWANVEIDGGGHDGEFDREREDNLRLPTLRLTKAHLANTDMLAALEARLVAAHATKFPAPVAVRDRTDGSPADVGL